MITSAVLIRPHALGDLPHSRHWVGKSKPLVVLRFSQDGIAGVVAPINGYSHTRNGLDHEGGKAG